MSASSSAPATVVHVDAPATRSAAERLRRIPIASLWQMQNSHGRTGARRSGLRRSATSTLIIAF